LIHAKEKLRKVEKVGVYDIIKDGVNMVIQNKDTITTNIISLFRLLLRKLWSALVTNVLNGLSILLVDMD